MASCWKSINVVKGIKWAKFYPRVLISRNVVSRESSNVTAWRRVGSLRLSLQAHRGIARYLIVHPSPLLAPSPQDLLIVVP